MKRLLPRKTEFAVLAVLSLILAALATQSASVDAMLAVLAIPLFIVCALLGMHRSGRLIPIRQESRVLRHKD